MALHSETKPVRIQRKRTKGFNLQALSHAMNGLECVCVDRSTKWGNPFAVGKKNPCGTITKDMRHSFSLYVGFAPQNEKLVEAAKAELRGKNLACWCPLTNHEHGCHADILLEIANA